MSFPGTGTDERPSFASFSSIARPLPLPSRRDGVASNHRIGKLRLHRKVRRLRAFEDAIDVAGCAVKLSEP
jgi:hypothetical protein